MLLVLELLFVPCFLTGRQMSTSLLFSFTIHKSIKYMLLLLYYHILFKLVIMSVFGCTE